MGIFELGGRRELTLRQRWATYIALMVAVGAFMLGLTRQSSALNRKNIYNDSQTGISALYPLNWLLDRSGEYVFRVRDMTQAGFKTSFQVTIIPTGADVTPRNVADRLALSRAQTLTDYAVLSIEPFTMPNGDEASGVLYTYVTRETSPFLEGIPEVVIGYDVLTFSRGQALIITYRAEASQYEARLALFLDFLRSLAY